MKETAESIRKELESGRYRKIISVYQNLTTEERRSIILNGLDNLTKEENKKVNDILTGKLIIRA
tara:strand:- start:284 stop:475 length:192 start_codon:yes stop_codon:yes gene_type:complete